jgi:hypothetical protein
MPAFRKFLFFFALVVIAVRPSIAADSLVVSPVHPTIMDSVSLSILERGSICCTQFSNDPTAVTLLNDSTVMLSFTTSQLGVCPCPISLDSNLEPVSVVATYKRGPLQAREYFVYEECRSCFGQACLHDSFVVAQSLIGTFTVSAQAGVVFHQKPVPLENIGKMSGNGRIYDIRGSLVSPNRIGASRQTPGVYFIKPDERSTAKLKVWY